MPIRTPVAAIDVASAKSDHKEHHRYFNRNDGGVESRTLFDSDDENRGDHQGNDKGGKVEPDLHPKQMWSTQQIMRSLQQFRRLDAHNRTHLVQEYLRAR